MKSLLLGFSLCLLVPLITIFADAQSNNAASDWSAVRATVKDYIEAYYIGDAGRMEQTLDPHYLKHVIQGSIPMGEKTGLQMVEDVRSHGPRDLPHAESSEQIQVLDVSRDIASAKLVPPPTGSTT